jgi:hypothetical protein
VCGFAFTIYMHCFVEGEGDVGGLEMEWDGMGWDQRYVVVESGLYWYLW